MARRFRGDGGPRLPECETCCVEVQEVYEAKDPLHDAIDYTIYCHGQSLRLTMSCERVMRYRHESARHPLWCEFRTLRFPRVSSPAPTIRQNDLMFDGPAAQLAEYRKLIDERMAEMYERMAVPMIYQKTKKVAEAMKFLPPTKVVVPHEPPPDQCRECCIIDGSGSGPLGFTIQYKHKGCLEALKKEVAKRNEERERVRFLAQKAEMRLAAEAGDSAVARAPAAPRRGVVIYCQNDEDVP